MRHARTLSRGTLFYKKVFPVVFAGVAVFVGATTLWRMLTGADAPFELMPMLGVAVVGYLITRFVGSELADEVLDAGDHLRVRKGEIRIDVPFRGNRSGEGVHVAETAATDRTGPQGAWTVRPRDRPFIPSRYSLMPLTERADVRGGEGTRRPRAWGTRKAVPARPTLTAGKRAVTAL